MTKLIIFGLEKGEIIQIGIFLVAAITLIVNGLSSRRLSRREIYQRLELASIDLFRFEMTHSDQTWRLYNDGYDIENASKQEKQEMINQTTQLMNLFEMSTELHNTKNLNDKIFSTWLKWIFDIASLKNFQYLWNEDLHNHYTGDLSELIEISISCEGNFETFIKKLSIIKHYSHSAKYLKDK